MLKIKVSSDLCSGHARCAAVAPDIYRLNDDGYCISDGDTVPDGMEALAQRGMRACPERAISLAEEQGTALPSLSPRDVAVAFFEHQTAGRGAAAWALLAPDVAYEIVAPKPFGGMFDREGVAGVAGLVYRKLVPPIVLTIKGITVEGERVALELVSDAATIDGRRYNNHYHFLFIIRDGLIVEAREYLDSAHLMDVIGA